MSIEIDGAAVRPPPVCLRCGAPSSGDHLARVVIRSSDESKLPAEEPV